MCPISLRLAAAAASGIGYALCFPPHGWTALIWVALVPLVLALHGARPGSAALVGGLFGLVIAAGVSAWLAPTLVDYFRRPVGLTAAVLVALWLAMASPYFALVCAGLALARRRVPPTLGLLLLPAAWVCAEFVRGAFGLRAAWTHAGDALVDAARLRQLAELTGVYGPSALVVLANALIAEWLRLAWSARRGAGASGRPAVAATLLFAALLGFALHFGEQRRIALRGQGADRREVEIALVQGNVPPSLRWQRIGASRVLRRYGALTREALAAPVRPSLVVWPENAIQTGPDDPVYGQALRGIVERAGAPLIFGAPRVSQGPGGVRHFNAAWLLSPGRSPVHYDKRQLLPLSESDPLPGWFPRAPRGDLDAPRFSAGEEPGLLAVLGRSAGVLLCYEAIYPALARELAGAGARLLLNLTNDGWFRGEGSREQHLRQVVYRAVETRLPLLRVSTTGVSAVIHPDGEIAQRLEADRADVLRAHVSLPRREPTFYVRYGDVFALACVGAWGAAAALGAARVRPRARRFAASALLRRPTRAGSAS